ncbi:LAMI_0B00100g1_1 [Lachancea mirantina]|uniref:LAMI_0B00100g1_1 n=1 Tax=Lachancea mirantina TaxID=1230905 RepID=A0A1G4ISV5_9SACH|nr:LAMI_0B00100g1_1 [Lachancea mirantina]
MKKNLLSFRDKRMKKSGLESSAAGVDSPEPGMSSMMMMDTPKKSNSNIELYHMEHAPGAGSPDDDENDQNVSRLVNATLDAKEANESERTMPLIKALKTYPKAAGWSLLVSTTLIMEGYDTAILGAFFALPIFKEKFGSQGKSGEWEISISWQVGLTLCYIAGEIVGLQLTGPLTSYIGNRYTMILALFLLGMFTFILYFCKSLGMIAVGQALCGMPWGCFQGLTVTYASEICPLALRYYLTTYSNLCWLFGQLFAAGIMKNSQNRYAQSELGYKLPFALQWLWPVPLMVGIFLAPESPWWLVKKGRMDAAKRSLERTLSGTGIEKDVMITKELEKIRLTIEKEKHLKGSEGSYMDCIRDKTNRRRTRIACLAWVGQTTCGAGLMGYSTYFYEKAGVTTDMSFTFSIIQYCLGIGATFISWWLSKRVGRFELYAIGLVFQGVVYFIIGGLGCMDTKTSKMASGALLMVVAFFYNLGIAPVVFCLVSEIPSSRLRTKTIILARNSYNVVAIVTLVLILYQLNSQKWNWGAKAGFFWGAFCFGTLAWAVVDLPETKGKTFGEINELFRLGVSARKFKSTTVDPFAIKAAEELFDDERGTSAQPSSKAESSKDVS